MKDEILEDSFKANSSSYIEVKIVDGKFEFDMKFKDQSEKLELLLHTKLFLDKEKQKIKEAYKSV